MQISVVLERYLDEFTHQFDWHTSNCCQFVSRWIQIVKGKDPMEGLPETLTKDDAHYLISQLGSLEEAVTRCLGTPAIPATLARVGDPVLLPLPNNVAAMGICVGRDLICLDEIGNRIRLKMTHATHAWRLSSC